MRDWLDLYYVWPYCLVHAAALGLATAGAAQRQRPSLALLAGLVFTLMAGLFGLVAEEPRTFRPAHPATADVLVWVLSFVPLATFVTATAFVLVRRRARPLVAGVIPFLLEMLLAPVVAGSGIAASCMLLRMCP